MDKKLVTKKFLDSYKPHLSSEGIESTRFYNDKYFLKILKKFYLKYDKKQIIERLDEIKHENAVTPEFLLYDKTGTIGYGSIYYKDYNSTDSLTESEISLPFSDRKKIIFDLCDVLRYFYDNNFIYYDIHGENIFYKDGNIKLFDLDGGLFKGLINNGFDYETALRIQNKNLIKYSLAFLYNLSYIPSISSTNYDQLLSYLSNKLKEFYNIAFGKSLIMLEDVDSYIVSINEELIEDTKLLLNKKHN